MRSPWEKVDIANIATHLETNACRLARNRRDPKRSGELRKLIREEQRAPSGRRQRGRKARGAGVEVSVPFETDRRKH